MFPWDEKEYISSQLADSLIWVIWQELIKSPILNKRVLASELLVNNTWVSNMIRKRLLHQIDWAIETWAASWMYTMEMNLEKLKKEWKL
jgi:twitching motility protein PilT